MHDAVGMVEFLLTQACNPNVVDNKGQTPMDVAQGGAVGLLTQAQQSTIVAVQVD